MQQLLMYSTCVPRPALVMRDLPDCTALDPSLDIFVFHDIHSFLKRLIFFSLLASQLLIKYKQYHLRCLSFNYGLCIQFSSTYRCSFRTSISYDIDIAFEVQYCLICYFTLQVIIIMIKKNLYNKKKIFVFWEAA